jgi:hypothetical protein
MSKMFWLVLLCFFMLVNENLVKFTLSLQANQLSPSQALEDAFRYSSIVSYMFTAFWRAIPFLGLAAFARFSSVRRYSFGRVSLWGCAVFITCYHFWGYYQIWLPVFQGGKLSSTSSLAIPFVSLEAVVISCCVFLALFILAKVKEGV